MSKRPELVNTKKAGSSDLDNSRAVNNTDRQPLIKELFLNISNIIKNEK